MADFDPFFTFFAISYVCTIRFTRRALVFVSRATETLPYSRLDVGMLLGIDIQEKHLGLIGMEQRETLSIQVCPTLVLTNEET